MSERHLAGSLLAGGGLEGSTSDLTPPPARLALPPAPTDRGPSTLARMSVESDAAVAMWRYLASAALALHGLIHGIGFAAAWQLGALSGVTAAPSLPTLNAGSAPVLVLGVVWLVAGAGFVLSGVGLAADRSWWVPVTAVSALLSLVLTGMWWQSAPAGIAIDLAVLACLRLMTRGTGIELKTRGPAH